MSIFTGISSAWARFKQWYHEARSHGAGKVLLNKYFIATLIFVVLVGFVDTNNVGEYIRTRRKLNEQQRQIEAYDKAIRRTEDKLNSLQSQKDSLEQFAREEYYYLEDGEDVFVIEQ